MSHESAVVVSGVRLNLIRQVFRVFCGLFYVLMVKIKKTTKMREFCVSADDDGK